MLGNRAIIATECLYRIALGRGKPVPCREICDAVGYTVSSLERAFLVPLKQRGFIRAVHGRIGGYLLTRHPAQISLGEVDIAFSEEDTAVNLPETPPVREVWDLLRQVTHNRLKQYTIATILTWEKVEEEIKGENDDPS